MSAVHDAILSTISSGHIQLRELTKAVNRKTKSRYLESTISARIRDLKGQYEKHEQRIGQKRFVYYIGKVAA
jgi:hypothetical protein